MYDLAVVCRKAPAWASLSYMGRDGDAGVLCDHREDDLSANLHIIIEKEKKKISIFELFVRFVVGVTGGALLK